MWKSEMAGDGGNKTRFQNCTDPSGQEILYLRALQGHSGRNLMRLFRTTSPSTFIISDVQSVYTPSQNSGLIAGGQNLSRERQTVFFTAVHPIKKDHKDPQELDFTNHVLHCIVQAEGLASYKQKKWKRHQDSVYWVDIQLAQRKDWSSIEQDVTQSSFAIHSQLIVCRK